MLKILSYLKPFIIVDKIRQSQIFTLTMPKTFSSKALSIRFNFSKPTLGRYKIINKAGFMLIELIIVLFLITLIIGLSTVIFANSLPSSKFNSIVREITSNIRYAKTSAKLKGENQIFYIDLDSRQYGTDGAPPKSLPPNINVKAVDPFLGEIYKGRYQAVFYSSGGLEGGTVIIFDNKRIATIYLDPVVGSIVVK